jgi:hypothetical protein
MDLPFLVGLSNIDILILIGAGLVFLVMAYMIFKQLMKAFIIGIISAAIPVVLYLFGFQIELSLQTVLWFGLAGIATYFVYDVINGWFTVVRILTWPIRKALKKDSQPKQQKQAKQKKEKEGDVSRLQAREEKKDSSLKDSEKKKEKSKSDDNEDYEEVK